ncbi:MAG TPA: glycosyltransferase [Polyangium sp.]|nr:glycosyltransferase [Polyangium sp.]
MRILITVGTAGSPFDRLLQYADEAMAALSEPATGVCQVGTSQIRPRNLSCKDTLSRAEFDAEIAIADVVMCHAGVGTLWTALREGHCPLVVPRLGSLGEHVNDHQVQIVEALHRDGRIVFIQSAAQMRDMLLQYERGEIRRGPRLGQDSSRFDKVAAAITEGPARTTTPLMGKFVLRLLGTFGPSIEKLRVG